MTIPRRDFIPKPLVWHRAVASACAGFGRGKGEKDDLAPA